MEKEQQLLTYKNYLVKWIQEEVQKANLQGVIVGLSGGVDSALVAALAKEAFPKNSLSVIMPIGDMGEDFVDAKKAALKLKIQFQNIDLTNAYETLVNSLKISDPLALANLKPRLRMTTLYALAQEKKYLVLGTDNAAEWILGYFTKYGDGGVDLLPIVHLKKQEVQHLTKLLDLPLTIYTKKPTAGLWKGQYDELELGFSYQEVDKYLSNQTVEPRILNKIKKQISQTAHKRLPVPQPLTIEEVLKKVNNN